MLRPEFMQRKIEDDIDKKYAVCLWDGEPLLPKSSKYYCSGYCMHEVTKRGLYGKEEAIKQQLQI